MIYKQIVWQFEALRQFCLIISGLVSDIGIFVVKIKKKNQQTKTQKDKNKDQKEFNIVMLGQCFLFNFANLKYAMNI